MEFVIKTYSVPIIREEGKIRHVEVKLGSNNLICEELIEIEFSADIPPEANKITNWNNMQLAIARVDESITTVEKKVLCSNIKP